MDDTHGDPRMKESPASYRISDLAATDRPRERLADVGPENFKTEELLAILLRVGVSGENAVQMGQRLLLDMKGLNGLQKATFFELAQQHGLGTAKAAQIKAAIELGRRLVLENPDQPVYLNNPQSAAELVKFEMAAFTQEHLWVLLADTRNRWISTEKIYKGSLNASTVRIGELFKPAIFLWPSHQWLYLGWRGFSLPFAAPGQSAGRALRKLMPILQPLPPVLDRFLRLRS